jgi:hypothetical protein
MANDCREALTYSMGLSPLRLLTGEELRRMSRRACSALEPSLKRSYYICTTKCVRSPYRAKGRQYGSCSFNFALSLVSSRNFSTCHLLLLCGQSLSPSLPLAIENSVRVCWNKERGVRRVLLRSETVSRVRHGQREGKKARRMSQLSATPCGSGQNRTGSASAGVE